MRSLAHQKTMHSGEMQGLRAAFDTQASKETPQVHLHGVLTDAQLRGNVTVGESTVEHQNQLLLTLG